MKIRHLICLAITPTGAVKQEVTEALYEVDGQPSAARTFGWIDEEAFTRWLTRMRATKEITHA